MADTFGSLAPNEYMSSYTPTLSERMTDWFRRNLFTDDRAGQQKAERVMNLVNVTPFGLAPMAYDIGRDAGQGNYGAAAVNMAMAMAPMHKGIRAFHGSPEKNITEFRASYKKPAFFAVDDGTARPREYASAYSNVDGQTYDVNIDPSSILDARTPEGRAALISALDATYPLGGEAYLWEKGIKEGALPGWGDDMIFRAINNAGYKGAYLNERPDVVSAAIFDPSIISMKKK